MMTDDDDEVSYLHSERTRLHWAVLRDNSAQVQIFLQNGEDPNIQDVIGNSPLHYLSSNNSELVETLVNHGANVDFKNKYDRTPLHALVTNKDPCVKDARLKSVKMLLEKGANVNSQDCKGSTPLHDLVQCILHNDWHPSDDDICDLLLAHGVNVQLQDLEGSTPLHLAVSKESIFTVKLLESTSGKSAVNIPDKYGDYPLHTAARKISFRMLTLLLDNGARIDCKNKYDRTPLHDLVSNKDPSLKDARLKSVKMLLEKGAYVNSQDCKGSTPLHDLVQCILNNDGNPSDVVICDLLLGHGANVQLQDVYGYTPLHFAESSLTAKLLKSTSGKSAVNIPDKSGDYPLHTAARKISFTMFKLLLDNGAIINCKNKYDRTPLHDLVSNKNPCVKDARLKSVKMLLKKGANVNSQDCKGSTPLHDLVQCILHNDGHPSDVGICDLLLVHGANVQLQDLYGRTPLHFAESSLTAKLLKSTSGKSAVNIPDKSGNYPLHTAVISEMLWKLELLLDNGAKINCKNGNGQTALHLTSIYFKRIRFTCRKLGELLLQRGAEVNSQDQKGRTSLDYAARWCVSNCKKYAICRRSPLHKYIGILLDWGASFGLEDASSKSRIDYSSCIKDQNKYEIRKTCLGIPSDLTNQMLPVQEFEKYEKYCRKEVNRMKAERHGNISLYDIFQQQFDPYFLLNEGLISTLRSTNLKVRYPIYASLLTATYHRSKERVKLFDSVSTILQTPLPLEMIRYIMTFVDNESLRNAIKAKELL